MTSAAPAPIVDNDQEWVKKQIDEYIQTDGAKPVFRYGAPLLLLTTRGRKSGQWRRTCLIGSQYTAQGRDDEYLIVASIGGAPKHPVWYLNLEAAPRVWLQVGAQSFWATARTATETEKQARWDFMVGLYPDYADYQKKTDRQIPVVILTRED